MRPFVLFILGFIFMSACGFRRDVPDETKVQSFPAWEPATSNILPVPE